MSCGFCYRGICFDDRAAAILAARAHAALHDGDAGADMELVVIEDALEHDRGLFEEWALAQDPELVQFDSAPGFHSSPPAIAIAMWAENPAAGRN